MFYVWFSDFNRALNKFRKTLCYTQLFVALLFVPALRAQIIDSPNIGEIASHVDEDVLVLFDVDNTLIQLPQSLGSPEWFADFYKKKLAIGEPSEKAMNEVVATYVLINKNSKAIPVDPEIAKVIEKLQAQGVPVLGLTSRDDVLAQATFRQLKSAEINLTQGKFGRRFIKLKTGEKSKVQGGVIFTGGKNKGHCLEEFLRIVCWVPQKIIFIDDQLKALQEVEVMLAKSNINYLGLRYGYLDHKVKAFNPKIAEAQLNHFRKTGRLLSDNDVLILFAKGEN